MDETLVRGLIVGVALGIIGFTISMIAKLIKSPTEIARRTRVVAGIAIFATVGLVSLNTVGVGGTVVVAAVIGAVVWIAAGKH